MSKVLALFVGGIACTAAFAQATGKARIDSGHTLVRRIEKARLGKCAVPLEWGFTYPVPGTVDGLKGYKLLAYAVTDRPKASERIISTPQISAFFPLNDRPETCKTISDRSKPVGERYSALAANAVTEDRDDALHGLTIEIATLYFAGASKNAASVALVTEYYRELTFLMEPGFRRYYYDLNPEFWKWVEMQTGKSLLPKEKRRK